MKIVICGAQGQLGCELSDILLKGRAEIGAIPPEYDQAEVIGTNTSDLDITDAAKVNRFIQEGRYDLILNCAAMTNVDNCEGHEDLAYAVNAVGAKNLACAAETAGAKLVHVSTDYVFSGEDQTPRIETDQTQPKSAYGRTKLAGEQFVSKYCARSYIVRTAWLYGREGSNFVKTIMRLARENGVIKVVDDQFGNPTSANDLAYEILKIAVGDSYGIYHCTNKGTCSWFDFACAIVDTMNIPCEKIPCTTEDFPRPAKRPTFSSLRNKHLEDTVGDEMRFWQDALKEYLNYFAYSEGMRP